MPGSDALSDAQRRTLHALAEVVVPHAFRELTPECDLGALTSARLERLPPQTRNDLALVLSLLNNAVARLAIGGHWTEWSQLDLARRSESFARWGRSRIPIARTAHQAIRRLVMATWYATPVALKDINVPSPLHVRAPLHAWEGPLDGPDSTDGLVATGTRSTPPPSPRGRSLEGVITRGATLRGAFRFSADVVVIGSGAGGSVAAAQLAEAGREVLILEGGPYIAPDELTEDEGALFPRLFADGGARATTDLSVSLLQGAAVGGGTLVNWMMMLRTPDHVLTEWQQHFGLRDLTSARLAPLFERIERALDTEEVPDAAHSPGNRLLLDGARKLGWHAVPARLNARGCVRAGTCSLGCRYGAKRSALETWLPRAFAAGARLLADTRVERIERLEADTGQGAAPMKRVHAVTRDERTGEVIGSVTVDARTVVVAAGAIETPALLTRSGMGGGGVGRFLRLHPTTAVLGVYEQEVQPLSGIPLTAMCDEFARSAANDYGFWLEVPAVGPGLIASAIPGFGAGHREAMQALAHTAPFIALVRDGADRRTSHGSVRVDGSGRTRISYTLGPLDRQIMRQAVAAAARLHLENGAQRVHTLHRDEPPITSSAGLASLKARSWAPNDVTISSAHVNGTCRMGTDPRISGTSPDGERFGERGLFVADGSLMPTAPGVNPQETVMALASLVADAIVARS